MKNKMILAGIVALLIVIVIAGSIFIKGTKKSVDEEVVVTTPEEQGIAMKAEDIGLDLVSNTAGTEVVMTITDVSKFNSFEYDMNYEAIVDGETVMQGATGSGDVEAGKSSIKRSITIGTCSSGKCRYDKGVTKISFILRLNLKDGQVGLVKKDLNLKSE